MALLPHGGGGTHPSTTPRGEPLSSAPLGTHDGSTPLPLRGSLLPQFPPGRDTTALLPWGHPHGSVPLPSGHPLPPFLPSPPSPAPLPPAPHVLLHCSRSRCGGLSGSGACPPAHTGWGPSGGLCRSRKPPGDRAAGARGTPHGHPQPLWPRAGSLHPCRPPQLPAPLPCPTAPACPPTLLPSHPQGTQPGHQRIPLTSACSSLTDSHWLQRGLSATTKSRLVLASLCAWKSLGVRRQRGHQLPCAPIPPWPLVPALLSQQGVQVPSLIPVLVSLPSLIPFLIPIPVPNLIPSPNLIPVSSPIPVPISIPVPNLIPNSICIPISTPLPIPMPRGCPRNWH